MSLRNINYKVSKLPVCQHADLRRNLCVNHEQLLGAVGDLMCIELLFVSIYSNDASAGLEFKNACPCVCVHVYLLLCLMK